MVLVPCSALPSAVHSSLTASSSSAVLMPLLFSSLRRFEASQPGPWCQGQLFCWSCFPRSSTLAWGLCHVPASTMGPFSPSTMPADFFRKARNGALGLPSSGEMAGFPSIPCSLPCCVPLGGSHHPLP